MTLAQLIERLERDRYSVAPCDNSVEYRKGWNEHAAHTLRWLRLEVGLAELRASDVERGI